MRLPLIDPIVKIYGCQAPSSFLILCPDLVIRSGLRKCSLLLIALNLKNQIGKHSTPSQSTDSHIENLNSFNFYLRSSIHYCSGNKQCRYLSSLHVNNNCIAEVDLYRCKLSHHFLYRIRFAFYRGRWLCMLIDRV